ncbi:MAG TPA: sulfite exporter TauE/SafE family protein [Candidatus Bathyarchaeia archaeon]|nr:sulfite exporter TauE/SafE family protein [Candidatus Bathyarchaeia archaeon]
MWDFYFYLLIGLLVFFGFTVRVIAGFGSTMLIAPILALFLEPKHTVVFVILLESAMGIVFIVKEKLNFEIKPIFVGGFSGIIAGIFLFGLLSQRLVGLIIGASVLTFSLLFLLNITFRTEKEKSLFTTLGFLSGSMGVLTGINGPQIVLGLVNQGYDATFIRRTMITYLIVIDFVTLASFSISGYLTANLLKLLIYSVPFLIFSYVAGTYVLKFVDPEKLKRIMLIITLFAGILAIWKFLPVG